jgi:NADH dehydrogenase/NADH:ubiquinone oxidoreductase subunit G
MMTEVDNHTLTLTLDGKLVPFTLGETIYEIAQRQGRFIPTLCYDPRLQPFGACRLCVVEVRGQRNPVASCTTPAVLGMEVTTVSDRLDQLRKTPSLPSARSVATRPRN